MVLRFFCALDQSFESSAIFLESAISFLGHWGDLGQLAVRELRAEHVAHLHTPEQFFFHVHGLVVVRDTDEKLALGAIY